MSMEQKSKYVAPSTRRVTVELEQGFMGASMQGEEVQDENSQVTSANQKIDDSFTFSEDAWND